MEGRDGFAAIEEDEPLDDRGRRHESASEVADGEPGEGGGALRCAGSDRIVL